MSFKLLRTLLAALAATTLVGCGGDDYAKATNLTSLPAGIGIEELHYGTGPVPVAGQGGTAGPPLDSTGNRHADLDWQVRHLKQPGSVVPGSTMPPYSHLSEADLKALATYLLSLR